MLPELSLVFLLGSTWLGTMLAEDPGFEFHESPVLFAVMEPDVSRHNSFSSASDVEGAGRFGKGGAQGVHQAGLPWHLLWADGQVGSLSLPRGRKKKKNSRQGGSPWR